MLRRFCGSNNQTVPTFARGPVQASARSVLFEVATTAPGALSTAGMALEIVLEVLGPRISRHVSSQDECSGRLPVTVRATSRPGCFFWSMPKRFAFAATAGRSKARIRPPRPIWAAARSTGTEPERLRTLTTNQSVRTTTRVAPINTAAVEDCGNQTRLPWRRSTARLNGLTGTNFCPDHIVPSQTNRYKPAEAAGRTWLDKARPCSPRRRDFFVSWLRSRSAASRRLVGCRWCRR